MESDGSDACFLAANYGLTPDDWQEDVLDAWLGRRRDGRWAASTCGLAVPRQNGKNTIIEIRELFGMVELGEHVLHTAHQIKTARKAFKRILSFFENERQYPELAELVKEIRQTNGQEAIVLNNGGSVEFVARTRSSGRGFAGVDLLVLDEAQDLDDDAIEALKPTTSMAALGNPQTIFTGTPPNPDLNQTGEVFMRVRSNGESGRDPRLCWHDFGVEDGPRPDLDDRSLWLRTNPALGVRMDVQGVEDEYALLTADGFARERLGWWGENPGAKSVIDSRDWDACFDARSSIVGLNVFGLEVPIDRSAAVIGTAGRNSAGKKHLEVVDQRAGTDWVVAWFAAKPERLATPVTIDSLGQAKSLIPDLEAAGVTVLKLNGPDVASACGAIYDEITQRVVAHIGQRELTNAVSAVVQQPRSDAWVWGRKHSRANISAMYAVTLAARGLTLAPEKPSGKAYFR